MSSKAEYTKLWRLRNKTKFLETEKAYYLNNKDRILSVKSKYEAERKSTDVNYKLRKNLRSRLSSAVKSKAGSAIDDLGCSIPELRSYLENKFEPKMDWSNWGIGPGKWQIDHITALCKYDLTDSVQLKQACHFTNLQPIWYEKHIEKSKLDIK